MTKPKLSQHSLRIDAIRAAAEAMTAQGQEPRKHHLVPSFYLERWSVGGAIRVTDVMNNRKTWESVPDKAGFERDFYRLEPAASVTNSPVIWETWLNAVEGSAAAVFSHIDAHGLLSMSSDQHSTLCHFLAVQFTRSRGHRLSSRFVAAEGYMSMYELGGDDFLRQVIRESGNKESPELIEAMRLRVVGFRGDPWTVPLRRSEELKMSGRSAETIAQLLTTRKLAIYQTAKPIVTSDEPLVQLYENMSVNHVIGGIFGAPIIVFPFAPTRVLAMVRSDVPMARGDGEKLDWRETLELNQVLAANAHRWVFSEPANRFGEKVFFPDSKGPGRVETLPSDEPNSELLHFFTPTRWYGESSAPRRPVSSIWPSIVPPPPLPTPAERENIEKMRRRSH